ncbi:hypothetical protein M6B38_331490 [Iris pallida]|uniref:Uncharacterized protein n=1 Tax=Iris pallida TaxID=29817 RepID=A0AAX6DH43_IRIPA|nr:hypothetical protein M6B38_246320 [Iris pallida]KAJ6835601.1 hypothetical protein M6B38_331490 [Iris pallida]
MLVFSRLILDRFLPGGQRLLHSYHQSSRARQVNLRILFNLYGPELESLAEQDGAMTQDLGAVEI